MNLDKLVFQYFLEKQEVYHRFCLMRRHFTIVNLVCDEIIELTQRIDCPFCGKTIYEERPPLEGRIFFTCQLVFAVIVLIFSVIGLVVWYQLV